MGICWRFKIYINIYTFLNVYMIIYDDICTIETDFIITWFSEMWVSPWIPVIFRGENGVCITTSWYTGTVVSPEIQGIPRIQMSRAHHWGKYLGEPSRDLSPREYSQRVCICKQAGVLSRVCARSMDKFLHPGHVCPCKRLLFRSGWPGTTWLKNVSNIYAASGAITIINEFPRSCDPETIIPRIKPFVRWGGPLPAIEPNDA